MARLSIRRHSRLLWQHAGVGILILVIIRRLCAAARLRARWPWRVRTVIDPCVRSLHGVRAAWFLQLSPQFLKRRQRVRPAVGRGQLRIFWREVRVERCAGITVGGLIASPRAPPPRDSVIAAWRGNSEFNWMF